MTTQQLPRPFRDDLTVGSLIGCGCRSAVYAGTWRGESVVVKSYTTAAIDKYRRRYRVSIAQFEHDRNAAFYDIPQLRPFVAQPMTWGPSLTNAGERCEFFVQQRVDGVALQALLNERRRLPEDVLHIIDQVVATASEHGLYDIDMSPSNFRMTRDGNRWRPMLFDFNMMPQHLHAPNPFVALLYKTGLRHPAHRDRWMLKRLRTWPD